MTVENFEDDIIKDLDGIPINIKLKRKYSSRSVLTISPKVADAIKENDNFDENPYESEHYYVYGVDDIK